ncbi:GUN4 domain-containing protein [Tolypothrix sp. NIES-4075]|uniref:caspase, EACC1-associated type n=1 Tax=Tolypothrix sp. NIES-4075 TaxID=2005459 RepID=UPI000B5C31BA|nr:GUN4 domain-containing protein [Tolypothrix sp. NIES-4075]GAX42887.1 GUN4 domain-containing protein [Tolypothrix sp. NIES-4075]
MAKKVALLVGVSSYQQGLSALPSATKDAKAIKQVLQHPDIGGFVETDITSLLNQPQKKVEDAIYSLFNNCSPDDLVLFYFSGHGVKDEKGNLYIATPTTRTDQNKRVLPLTAIAASFVKDQMSASPSRRQVVILDCCFSGAFAKGLTLGNKSWAVLTSSDTVEYSYAPEPSELSIYTRYLVEGIKTGVGDLNNDGNISVDELYEYTKKKVKEISPKMNPLLDNGRGGYKIVLANSIQDDPKLKYRKKVEEIARQEERKFTSFNRIYEGNISDNFHRIYLDDLRNSLNLTKEDAKAIETEVLTPYCLRKNKLNSYGKVFAEAIKQGYPLSQQNRQMLKDLQQVKNLRDEDVEQIEKRILDSLPTPPITNHLPKPTIGGTTQVNSPQIPQPTKPNKTQPVSNPSPGNKNIGANKPSPNVPTIKHPTNSVSLQPSQPPRQNPTQDNLDFEQAIKYTKLRDLLAAKKWKEADEETAKVMLRASGKELLGYLSEDDIKRLPTKVLDTINQLWVKNSGGRFGFSVQKSIYLQASKNYDRLGDRLGWKKEGKWLHWRELNFSEQAPKGHLPSGTCPLGTVEGLIWDGCNVVSVLLSRSDF